MNSELQSDYVPYNLQGYDPCQGMTEEERMKAGCLYIVGHVTAIGIAMLLCVLLSSCTTTEYVPVTETRTEHHWHTDSVRERDSTHTERNTIIREVDSAAMAKYGIQMQANQRAWLVLQREMENRLRELEHRTAQRDTVRDSILVPYPVEVVREVPAELTWWQQARMKVGGFALLAVGVAVAIAVCRRTSWFSRWP